MQIINAIILAVVEGITEFLPISSTGHLILTAKLLNVPQTEFVKTFEIVIQLGAILAIVALYWKRLLMKKEIWLRVLAGFLPTAIVGLILYKFIKEFLIGNVEITLLMLFSGGVLLILSEKIHIERDTHAKSVESMSLRTSFLIGLFQSLSIIPGVSRSGASIISALFFGVKRQAAVEYSFFLAIPTMLAASGLDLLKTSSSFTQNEFTLLIVGFVGAFLVAILAVKLFVEYVQKHSFVAFGIYRIILSILFWLFIVR